MSITVSQDETNSIFERMATALQAGGHSDATATSVVERVSKEIPGYQELPVKEIAPLVERQVSLLFSGLATHDKPSSPELREIWQRGGEERAAQGVPLEDMLHGWRIGLDVTRQRIHAIAEELEAPPAVLLEMLELALSWTDAGMLSGAAGHRAAELEVTRQQRDYRINFLRRVLSGGLSSEDLRLANAYSINRQGRFHAVRARPTDEREAMRIQRELRPAHSTDQRDGLIAMIDGDICGFVAQLPSRCGSTVGISEPVTLTELPTGFRLATRALDVGLSLGREGLIRFDDLGLLPAVHADEDVSAGLTARLITPILELGQSGEAILETISLFIRNGLRYELTAKELFVHVNTVRYRVNRFEELTGQSLRDGDTIVNTWWSLAHHRLIPDFAGPPEPS